MDNMMMINMLNQQAMNMHLQATMLFNQQVQDNISREFQQQCIRNSYNSYHTSPHNSNSSLNFDKEVEENIRRIEREVNDDIAAFDSREEDDDFEAEYNRITADIEATRKRIEAAHKEFFNR